MTSSVLGSGSLGSVEAVPESSTWAMMMAGFAGLGLIGCRAARKTLPPPDNRGTPVSDRVLIPQPASGWAIQEG